jgi:hypothetical protein
VPHGGNRIVTGPVSPPLMLAARSIASSETSKVRGPPSVSATPMTSVSVRIMLRSHLGSLPPAVNAHLGVLFPKSYANGRIAANIAKLPVLLATTATAAVAADAAKGAAAAAGSYLLDTRVGLFLVKDTERRQADVGNFFLTEGDFITL